MNVNQPTLIEEHRQQICRFLRIPFNDAEDLAAALCTPAHAQYYDGNQRPSKASASVGAPFCNRAGLG